MLSCLLFSLTYEEDPRVNPQAKLISVVEELNEHIFGLAGGSGSALGTGGMITKLKAARIATEAGCQMVIVNGRNPNVLYDVINGKNTGTRFLCREKEG